MLHLSLAEEQRSSTNFTNSTYLLIIRKNYHQRNKYRRCATFPINKTTTTITLLLYCSYWFPSFTVISHLLLVRFCAKCISTKLPIRYISRHKIKFSADKSTEWVFRVSLYVYWEGWEKKCYLKHQITILRNFNV